jgi:hypothetical protein
VGGGVAQGPRHTTAGGEMEDRGRGEVAQRPGRLGAPAVGDEHLHTRGRRGAAGMAEVVDDEHGAARRGERVDGVRADEAGPAGDRDPWGQADAVDAYARPSRRRWRSSVRRILPLTVLGSSVTKWTSRGYL